MIALNINKYEGKMAVLVGKQAPDFTASAVMPDNSIDDKFNLTHYRNNKMAVIFFYPLDFTFVCPSEIIEFNEKLDEFKKRDVKVLGISVDSKYAHLAYKNTPLKEGGIGNIQFPLVADLKKSIASDYDVLFNGEVALRGTFLIDQDGIVRHQIVNDLPLGRNIDEAIRMVDALQFFQDKGEVCPAGWRPGKEGMKATREGVAKYLAKKSA
jgi:peroxiredoxin (alkyl hydroperoxide reductase subunit C)